MANTNFNPKKHINAVQEEIIEILEEYGNTEKERMAVASAFLGVVIPMYEDSLGTERTAVMMYKVADELAVRVPSKVTIPTTNFSSRKFRQKSSNKKRKT